MIVRNAMRVYSNEEQSEFQYINIIGHQGARVCLLGRNAKKENVMPQPIQENFKIWPLIGFNSGKTTMHGKVTVTSAGVTIACDL